MIDTGNIFSPAADRKTTVLLARFAMLGGTGERGVRAS